MDTCCPAEAVTGEYTTVIPRMPPVGDGDTVAGVPEGLGEPVGVDVGVGAGELVADEVPDGVEDSVGIAELEALDESVGPVVVADPLAAVPPAEHAPSTSGRATTPSVTPRRRRDAGVVVRFGLDGMGLLLVLTARGAPNVRRPPGQGMCGA